MKDDDNSLQVNRQPGPLVPLLGGRVEQWYAQEKDVPVSGLWGTGESKIWAEQLSVSDPATKVLMRYGKSNGWLDGQPAAITRKVGAGSITYIGAGLDDTTLANAAKWMVSESNIQTLPIDLPSGVDLYIRSRHEAGGDHTVYILINFGSDAATVKLPSTMTDVLNSGTTQSVTLNPYDVRILSKD
jgi:beta-galactosidase